MGGGTHGMRISPLQDDLFGFVEDEEGDSHAVTHLGTLRDDHCPSAFDFSRAADLPALGWTYHQESEEMIAGSRGRTGSRVGKARI